jgi:hypothetical protein
VPHAQVNCRLPLRRRGERQHDSEHGRRIRNNLVHEKEGAT